jgi:hypothetical protein
MENSHDVRRMTDDALAAERSALDDTEDWNATVTARLDALEEEQGRRRGERALQAIEAAGRRAYKGATGCAPPGR